ncbi:Lrp/AsnC family transcriptional regulator [Candidatus Micrarchaeota archaeon]|nr:Lrp/AsnC family transcriptional regulator [Candidatus Micrarchaeota archaeon]
MYEIDKTDTAIIGILKDNARLSVRQISKKCGVPSATVHKRMLKLENEGVIERYSAVINKAKLGKETIAYVLVRIKPEADYTSMMEQVEKREEVEDMSALAGQFDLILKIRVRSIPELDAFVMRYLRKFKEVAQTQTLVVFRHWH